MVEACENGGTRSPSPKPIFSRDWQPTKLEDSLIWGSDSDSDVEREEEPDAEEDEWVKEGSEEAETFVGDQEMATDSYPGLRLHTRPVSRKSPTVPFRSPAVETKSPPVSPVSNYKPFASRYRTGLLSPTRRGSSFHPRKPRPRDLFRRKTFVPSPKVLHASQVRVSQGLKQLSHEVEAHFAEVWPEEEIVKALNSGRSLVKQSSLLKR